MSARLRGRVSGAPITWGVCEVPGWGHQLPSELVLTQMRGVGIDATELGPDGFLPADPAEAATVLADAGLRPVGQFVPVVLHQPDHDPMPTVEQAIENLQRVGAEVIVLAAVSGTDGYDARPDLDDDGWRLLTGWLDRIDEAVAAAGLRAVLHPHVGTMVESGEETARVLAGSGIALCLDTGHLLIGGADPVELAARYAGRIGHVHLKDVRADLAAEVREGVRTYTEAVAAGMYVPLGAGDVDIAAIVTGLEAAGYSGWYVLEQDIILTGAPPDTGVDPVAQVRASIAHLQAVAEGLEVAR